VLGAIKALGVTLALDDFGTGYSSLSYMRRFPIDTLKVDRSFVRELTTDAGSDSVVSAIINMGRSLHKRVVAVGVETVEQLAFLQGHGCSEAQGDHFSRPLLAADFAAWIRPTRSR
jgi:EAL domain-containing protein (putative c-di-GMP-specific phosphodiesterase class I)